MRERRLNTEDIWGKAFRVPSIVGLGSGRGFQFKDLHLPRDWETVVGQIHDIDSGRLRLLFEEICQDVYLNPGEIKFNSKSGLLTKVSVKDKVNSSIELATDFTNIQNGAYLGKDINSLQAAIVLQNITGTWLKGLWRALDFDLSQYYSLIGGRPGSYSSHHLRIPKEFWDSQEGLTNSHYRSQFALQASNIAGRFGLTLRTLDFNEKGVPESFDIHEGDACGYHLDANGNYSEHNVNSAEQVSVLHGIGASFINDLLRRKYQD